MARWLVTQVDRQFSAEDLDELKKLASKGEIGRGDMIQPPGASDWLYAVELPELKGLLPASSGAIDDFDVPKRGVPPAAIAAVLLAAVAGGGYYMYTFAEGIRNSNLDLLENLELTQMLVTADGVQLRSGPEASAAAVGSVAKNATVQLEAKRHDWYRVTSEAGVEGWVTVDQVIPAYMFTDAETREDYDPLYNPDQYVFVKNAGWLQMPNQRTGNVTSFSFLLQNKSKFDMENIMLLATIKDKAGKVLEKKEIRIEGRINRLEGTMVGMLQPDPKDKDGEARLLTETTFQEMLKEDEELQLRWVDGIEVKMESEDFEQASIDLLEVRAIPKKVD